MSALPLPISLLFLGLFAKEVAAPCAEPSDQEAPAPDPTACVTHTTEARYIMGFNHLVHIDNTCEKSVQCSVSTDVNPEPQVVNLAAKSKTTVVTFKGSPARTFRATVQCQLAK